MIIIIFLFGVIIGSFLNMLVWRMYYEENILGRSYCDKTKEQLQIRDLIPIFSYIFSKGKCNKCGGKIPLVYPIVEILSGVIAGFVYFRIDKFAMSYSELFIGIFTILLLLYVMLYFAVYDYHYWAVEIKSLIHAFIVIFIMIIINHFYTLSPLLPDLLNSIFGGLAGMGIIGLVVYITKGGGMGQGDIFLFGLAGLIVGLDGLWWSFMWTVITGAIIGLIGWIFTKKLHGVKIQFAPLITFGVIVVLLYKLEILELVSRYLYL